MKKHNHFLKKLTAGLLGFVMTLGVGAAGYSASAAETHADSATFTLTTGFSAPSTSGNVTLNWAKGSYSSVPSVGSTYTKVYAGNELIFTPDSGYKLTKIVLTASSSSYIKTWSSSDESSVTVSSDKATWEGESTSSITLTNTATGQARIKTATVTYDTAGQAKSLYSITGIEGTLSAKQSENEFDLTGLIPKGTLSDATTTIVDISKYVTLSTTATPSSGGAGTYNVSVTVTPKSGSVSPKSFNVSATVLASAIFEDNINDMGVNLSAQQVAENALWNDGDEDTAAVVHNLRLSSSEWWGSPTTTSMLGDYNGSGNGVWSKFSANKYYSSIASVITSTTYGFAMYTQNFSVNKPSSVEFDWSAVSGLGGTSNAYIVASSNGGYSWSVLKNVSALGTNKSISWSGSDYANTNNVILGLAYTSTTQNAQLRNIGITIYGDSLSMTNVWALREITISGSDSVEAEKSITLTGTAVTDGYETPANTGITWSSNNTSVATVDATTGEVTGVSAGTATITATAADGNGASASKTITVTAKQKALSSITLNTDNVQKSFARKSAFNSNNLVVTANYSNGFASETVTPTSVTPPDMTVSGTGKTVTVSYTLGSTTKTATYTIDITDIVSSEITIDCANISYNETLERYELSTIPSTMVELTVEYDGDEESYSAVPTNEKIYVEEGYLMVESTTNDTGEITFSCGNATATLFVTVVADESYATTPGNAQLEGVVGLPIEFSISLLNATSADWSIPTSDKFEIDGDGDEELFYGTVTASEVCEDEEFTISVETSNNTFEITFTLNVVAPSLTSIEVDATKVNCDYELGQSFDPYGLVVTGYFDNNTDRPLLESEYSISEPDMFTVNAAEEVTVTANGTSFTDSFTINVHVKPGVASGYTLVTSTNDLEIGTKYIIAAATDNFAMGAQNVDGSNKQNNRRAAVITKNTEDNTISFEDNAGVYLFTLGEGSITKDSSGNDIVTYTFKNGDDYLAAINSSSNKLGTSTSVDGNTSFSIAINAKTNVATIKSHGSFTRNVIQFNPNNYTTSENNPLFSCYSSESQKALHLYKEASSGEYDVIKVNAALTTTRDLSEGDVLNPADFAPISALYNDGNPAVTLTEDDYPNVTISYGESNALKEGDNIVTVSYQGISVDVPVNGVKKQTKTVESITMGVEAGKTATTAYYIEEGKTPAWDFSNIQITVHYSTGEDDEVLTIPQAMTKYNATVSPEVPTVGTDGFTVSMTVLGVSIGDNGHFSASVNNLAITGISKFNFTKEDLVLSYFDGDAFDSSGINSVTFRMNDGSTKNVNKADFLSFGISVGLMQKTTDTSLTKTLIDGTELTTNDDGYYLAVKYGNFIQPTENKIEIAKKINEVSYTDPTKPSGWSLVTSTDELFDGMKFVIVSSNKVMDSFDSSKRYLGAAATVSADGKSVTMDSATTFTLKANGDKWNIVDNEGAIQFTGTSNQNMIRTTLDTSLNKQKFTIAFNNNYANIANAEYTSQGLRYNSSAGYMSNYGASSQAAIQIFKESTAKEVYSNINSAGQHAALEFANWFITNVTSDATDAKWAQAVKKYGEFVTTPLKDDATALANAQNLLKYATAKSGEGSDALQQCVEIYDAYIAKYNLKDDDNNFLNRDVAPTNYTVNLVDAISEESLGSFNIKYGEKYGDKLTTPTKDGYEFKGWFTTKTGSTEVTSDSAFNKTEEITLYAQWTKKAYTITLDSGDCDTEGSLSIESYQISGSAKLVTITPPVKEGYTPIFTVSGGQATISGNTIRIPANSYGNVTVTTTWQAIESNVTFDSKGGSTVEGITVSYDGTYGTLPEPTKNGYDFAGWYTKDGSSDDDWGTMIESTTKVTITENQTLYAKWTLHTYNITFNKGDGATGGSLSAYTYQMSDGSQIITITDPTKTGMTPSYTVSGGGATIDGNTITIPANKFGDIAITTTWTGNPYVISFDGNGGSTPSNVNVEYGKAIESLPESTLEHYTFLGWFTEKDGGTQVKVGDVYNTEDNTTLYAHWEANKHTVVINGKEQEVNYDNQIVLDNEPTEVKEGGYFFNGWVCDADKQLYEGGATYTMPDKDVSFSAQWIKTIDNTITVTTQANFTYKYTVAGGFQEVTGYSLRMYVSLDEVSYQYYVEHGYTFTINFINNGNHRIQELRNVPMWYDSATDCWVFDIAVNIPESKLTTSLGVELVATPEEGKANTSNTVNVTYMGAAQALYEQYIHGDVELNQEQADALRSILGITEDAE